ncbi:hypothetical protein [Nocardia carnea]|uniref:hypothetical protein n=1 Tax=Nocardia carnea TaxID=37328 RepID=UPI002455D776|nr:hypothetical protein [Nocardia carnea]
MRTPPITPAGLRRLPARDRLLIALCSKSDDPDPICAAARDLVRLHRTRAETPERGAWCENRSIEIITAIDDVVATTLPSLAGARPRSVGVLIDRMAAAAEYAMRQLAVAGARSEQMHEAWTRLAELEIEYSDLIRHTGQRAEPARPLQEFPNRGVPQLRPGLRRQEAAL